MANFTEAEYVFATGSALPEDVALTVPQAIGDAFVAMKCPNGTDEQKKLVSLEAAAQFGLRAQHPEFKINLKSPTMLSFIEGAGGYAN